MNYCDTRLSLLGITDEQNTVTLDYNRDARTVAEFEAYKIFDTTEKDGIRIAYLSLNKYLVQYVPTGQRWKKDFNRERIHPQLVKHGNKYAQPAGSGVEIFFPPALIDKYKAGTAIETLYFVEGEIKAFVGSLNGLDILGIPSIHAYKLKGETTLHPDIIELCRVCKPENIVIIFDADAIETNWKKFEQDERYDLGKRAILFYSAVKGLRDCTKNIAKDTYFAHINDSFLQTKINESTPETIKGLDDLFLHKKGDEQKVIADLQKFTGANIYFKTINLQAENPGKLREYFYLNKNKQGAPIGFYKRYANKLKGPFVFGGNTYEWNTDKDDLMLTKHKDSGKFIRVGCDYLKEIKMPTSTGGIIRKLQPWKSSIINQDYVSKGFKNFYDDIKKYDAFCNVPFHIEPYRQTVEDCYNLYFELKYKPEKGKWKVTENYLHHVFGSKYDVGIDYLTLLYTRPLQKLPILVLVNKERRTGKSTILWWLQDVFNENAVVIGNQEITDNYNDDFASKLIIGLDEGLIEKKTVSEKIKSWATAFKISMNTKFLSRTQIDFFAKIIITSNNEDSFVNIDNEEVRYFVNKVPVFEGAEDPDILEKMRAEIPAFLEYIATRKMNHPRKTRLYFDEKLLITDALLQVKKQSRSWVYKEIISIIIEKIYEYENHTLYFTITEIRTMLNDKNGATFQNHKIENELINEFKILQRKEYAQVQKKKTDDPFADKKEILTEPKQGRFFRFDAEKFMNDEQLNEMKWNRKTLEGIHATMDMKFKKELNDIL